MTQHAGHNYILYIIAYLYIFYKSTVHVCNEKKLHVFVSERSVCKHPACDELLPLLRKDNYLRTAGSCLISAKNADKVRNFGSDHLQLLMLIFQSNNVKSFLCSFLVLRGRCERRGAQRRGDRGSHRSSCNSHVANLRNASENIRPSQSSS